MIIETIVLGAAVGAAVFTLLACLRMSWRYSIIRQVRSEEYLVGWKDGVRTVKDVIETWVPCEPKKR